MYRLDLGKKQASPKVFNKNREIKKKRGAFKKLLLFVFFFSITLFALFTVDGYINLGDSLDGKSGLLQFLDSSAQIVNKIIEPELENTDGITSVLIVGVDTRDVSFEDGEFVSTDPNGQAGTRNTDTIIQAVYNHRTNRAYLISIPRDMGVDIETECFEFHGSIHWVYDKAQTKDCPGGGVAALNQVVENVTGIPVHYHGFVTLEGFMEVIETIGVEDPETGEKGIYVDNPEKVWEVYPTNDFGWENVFFDEGRIFLTPDRALKYVRSRQTTTDFGRAQRQQVLIEAIVSQLISSETLLNPTKIKSLIDTFSNQTIITMPSLKEISAGLEIAQKASELEITNLVLEPGLGGDEVYINKQPHDRSGGPYYMVPTHWRDCPPGQEFCRVQQYVNNLILYPDLHNEQASIFAYATKYENGSLDFDNSNFNEIHDSDQPIQLTKSKYLANISSHPELGNYSGLVILDFTEGQYPYTEDFFENAVGASVIDGSEYTQYQINKEDFTILVL